MSTEMIRVIQFNGHNDSECLKFCPDARDPIDDRPNLIIPTLEGDILCTVGDLIVKDQSSNFRVIKLVVFSQVIEKSS